MNYKLVGFLIILFVSVSIFMLLNIETSGIEKSPTVTATDVFNDNLKDPVIVSRAYFTDPVDGPTGTFTGYPSSWSEDNRLHSFTHEKS